MFRFMHPAWRLLLLAMPVAVWLIRRGQIHRRVFVRFPSFSLLDGLDQSWPARLRPWLLVGLRLAGLALAVLALARPQAGHSEEELLTRGIDIVIAIDHSGSMAAEDFKPRNRLHVAKEVVTRFIEGRKHDRIGMGLASAVNRLRRSDATSRVIILLTDGRNNRGQVDPLTASQLASTYGIKIYSIGVGTEGEARFPIDDPMFGKRYAMMRVELDEETLTQVAELTGGYYFRATDSQSLSRIFERIDALERSDIKVRQHVLDAELFPFFLWPAAVLLVLEQLLRATWMRTIP